MKHAILAAALLAAAMPAAARQQANPQLVAGVQNQLERLGFDVDASKLSLRQVAALHMLVSKKMLRPVSDQRVRAILRWDRRDDRDGR